MVFGRCGFGSYVCSPRSIYSSSALLASLLGNTGFFVLISLSRIYRCGRPPHRLYDIDILINRTCYGLLTSTLFTLYFGCM